MKKLILFELRKVFSKRLALIALIGIILFSALLSFSTFQNKYAFDQNIGEGTGKTAVEIDKEIAAKYKGILTDEKVQQLMSDFAPTSDLHGLSAIYVYQNAMQSAAFSRFSDEEGKWNGLSVSDVFGNEEIKIGYVEAFIPFNITCGTLLKYQILLAFTCTLSVTGITLFLSAISKNQIVALVAAMAIFLFPVLLPITEVNPLFRLVGLLPIYHVLTIALLSVEQMSNGMLYAIWAIPAALLFLGVGAGISRRVFAKHQVL